MMVDFKKIKAKHFEYSLPIMLLGCVIYAIGWIVEYIVEMITGTSYIQIRFIVLVGMCIVVIGASSFLYLVKGEIK